MLTFASVRARLESGATVADETSALPAPPAEAAVVHQIDEQRAGVINNVDRDQYISHVQYVNQQRENFLREVAATKTKARWLAWTGFLMFVVEFGIFAAADLSFINGINDAIQNGGEPPPTTSPFGREIGGVPFGLVGWALAAATCSGQESSASIFGVRQAYPRRAPSHGREAIRPASTPWQRGLSATAQGCPISCRGAPAPRTYQERCQPLRVHVESSAGPGSGLRVRPRLTIRRN